LAIFLPKIIKVGGNLTKLCQKIDCFLDTVYRPILCAISYS